MPGCWALELSVHDSSPRGRGEVLRHDRADRYLATVPTNYLGRFVGQPGRCQLM